MATSIVLSGLVALTLTPVLCAMILKPHEHAHDPAHAHAGPAKKRGLGVILLYAMWLSHLLLFRGEGLAAWIGLMVVVQNVLTSLFNSHLVDFHEGWMYVLGVSVAGGMVLGERSRRPADPGGA